MPPADEPESRQEQIIATVLRHGPMTIADLAEALGMAKTSLRPQLDRLVLQGWLGRGRRRRGPGRPADVFSASEQSRRRAAQETTGEFARFLLEEVADTETRTRLTSVVKGVGRRLTHLLRPILGEGPPAERVRRLSEYLSERGILNDVSRSGQKITLSIHTCPYAGLAGNYRQICAMHRETLAELLGGETVAHRCRHDGHAYCDLKVTIAASKSATGRGGRPRPARPKKTSKRRR